MIYTISDTHFGHANIIKYCHRPFNSVEEMDATMIERWNQTVAPSDEVYFVGDLAFGKTTRAEVYAQQLNGKITWIKGNHLDPKNTVSCAKRRIGKYEFVFCHDPKNLSNCGFWPTLRTWAVCGHHHNNHLVEFPFFDRSNHRFNVSAELINYTPVSLDRLVDIIESKVPRLRVLSTTLPQNADASDALQDSLDLG